MNEGFQFIDIVFFAMIAAFLVLRLRSVLGRRTGTERQRPDPFAPAEPATSDKVVELPRRSPPEGPVDRYAGTPVGAGITQIKLADPGFNPDVFLEGARAAFEMIVGAFAAADVKALKPLLNDEVYHNFSTAIAERERKGETMEAELVAIKSAEIVEAGLEERQARVTVRFVTDQVNVFRDGQGNVADGDPNRIASVTDEWTFARDTRSRDPNWLLVATRVPEE